MAPHWVKLTEKGGHTAGYRKQLGRAIAQVPRGDRWAPRTANKEAKGLTTQAILFEGQFFPQNRAATLLTVAAMAA